MNTITIQLEVEDEQLLQTLYQTLLVEVEHTQTERGGADIQIVSQTLLITINGTDYVACRALSNSLLRLLKTRVDVIDKLEIKQL